MAQQFIGFAITFVAFFALMFTFLAMVDALPEPLSEDVIPVDTVTPVPNNTHNTPIAVQTAEAPVRVVAKSIGMDNTVLNPESTDVAALDAALLKGTIRYPHSAMLGVNGTVLLFGHSSYLPVVRNQNYKAFNGIQKLREGEVVSVYSAGAEYRYKVTSVRLANAEEDVVELPSHGKFLTLVTCDTFGEKSDRFVVTAELEGVYAL